MKFSYFDKHEYKMGSVELNSTDHKLLAELRRDARASITTLAGRIGVSRATIQTRLDRLISSGTIERFTIELDASGPDNTVRAIMLVALKGNLTRPVIKTLRGMPEIVSLYTTNGAWDLVANLETSSLSEFDRVLREVREVSGVLNSETCLLLDAAKA